MSRRFQAQIGLLAFAVVLAISLATIVGGYLRPTYVRPLAVGDRVPDFALPDETGTIHELASLRSGYVLLVYPPAAGLSEQQALRIGELRKELEGRAMLQSIALLDNPTDYQCRQAHQLCNLVLLDPHQILWPIRASKDGHASVCLLDRYGYLQLRAELPVHEAIAADPVERPTIRLAISTIAAGQLSR